MTLTHNHIRIDDINIHYVESGPQAAQQPLETIVFLHGFPEFWGTWDKQLAFFSQHYRVIAPDLPGYNLSDKPNNIAFYALPNLINVMSKLIAALSPDRPVTLVAHDWGGAIAWPLAAFKPHLIRQLVILNAAHPSTFTREMINNPHQRSKSDYIHQLIGKDGENLLTQDNYRYLTNNILQCENGTFFTADVIASYRQVWQHPGAVNGMLQYYRAMPQLAAKETLEAPDESDKRTTSASQIKPTSEINIPNIRINIPTLVLWGEQDLAFVNENLNGLTDYVPDCTIKRFPNTSHWIQHEQPDEVNLAINEFINSSK
ncbi:epoxide hydrolase [Shewanella algicola]|uniref:Alpha/beta hydrolase n=1 Tax=Shewanella algicola TaxID=640633 RepID=A0A9X2CDS0_9GAMM|nr:alpha/beta hydrolase [Shewanella algicola]MCL1105462.1 alpha/beta hydrolase [Shewanella algicola]GGP42248.1 epoxide hydrolase [Shewanella algicola]